MINIRVESELVTVTREFKSNSSSITFLKRIKKMQEVTASYRAGAKPKFSKYGRKKMRRYKGDLRDWKLKLSEAIIPVKVYITHN